MSALRKNVASQVLTFCAVNATTGAALTGATVTTKVTLDGTQSASAGTLTELGTGQYKYVPTQGETNGTSVGFGFTATNMVPVNLHCFTTAQDPTDAVRFGLTALPNAAAEAAGGLYTRGTGAGQIEQEDNGKVSINVKQWLRGTIPAVNVTGVPKVDVVDWLGVAPNALFGGKVDADANVRSATAQAGAASSITLDASASATDSLYFGQRITILSGTGAGQARLITNYVGATKVASVKPNWTTTPDNTSVFVVSPWASVDVEQWGSSAVSSAAAGIPKVDVDTIKTNPVVNGGTATFPTNATLASTTNLTAGTITTATTATNVTAVSAGAITSASFAAAAIDAAAIATDAIGAAELAADAVTEIWAKACTEPTAVVAASPTALAALSWLLTLSRNLITQTATTQILKADDGTTTIATSTVADDATTFSRGEFV